MGNPEQLKQIDPSVELALDDAATCSRFDKLAHECEEDEKGKKKGGEQKKPQRRMLAYMSPEQLRDPELAILDEKLFQEVNLFSQNRDLVHKNLPKAFAAVRNQEKVA